MGETFPTTSTSSSTSSSTSVAPKPFTPPSLPRLSSDWLSRLVFLGTGTSGQVPAIGCVLPPPPPPSWDASERGGHKVEDGCEACSDALSGNGFQSPNRRGCCSVAVIGGGARAKERGGETNHGLGETEHEDDESLILIDCGPTFYPAALRFFPPNKLRRITALLLTHGHADAILGLDSLRAWTMRGVIQSHVDVYCTQQCFDVVAAMFPYLVDSSRATGGGGVAGLVFHIISSSEPFTINDAFRPCMPPIHVQPLPLLHGFQRRPGSDAFECLGFRINELSYASDCHHVPSSTVELMRGSQVVVVDALTPTPHPSHFSLAQALSFVCSMGDEKGRQGPDGDSEEGGRSTYPGPKLALLTDLTHRLEHRKTEANVQRWTKEISNWASLRYDGDGGAAPLASTGQQQEPSEVEERQHPSEENNGKSLGEGGGKRWWAGAWYEDWCESNRADLSLAPSARKELELAGLRKGIEGVSLSLQNGSVEGHGEDKGAAQDVYRARSGEGWHVPEVHIAWDGMVVEWDRNEK